MYLTPVLWCLHLFWHCHGVCVAVCRNKEKNTSSLSNVNPVISWKLCVEEAYFQRVTIC